RRSYQGWKRWERAQRWRWRRGVESARRFAARQRRINLIKTGWRGPLGDLRLDGLCQLALEGRGGALCGRRALDPIVEPAGDRGQGENGHRDDKPDEENRPQRN